MRSPWGSRSCDGGRDRGRDGCRDEARDVSEIGGEAGSITAEFALVLPAVILVLCCCLGAIAVVGQQVRMTDAAAGAARALGRGESVDSVAALVNGTAPGATLGSESRGEFICATLSAPSGVGPFALVGLIVTAVSCAPAGGL